MTKMICPICRYNGVSFFRIWIKSGWGDFTCRNCSTKLKVKKNIRLALISILLAGAAFTLGYATKSWLVFFIALVIALILDAAVDWQYRVLIPADHQ